MVVLVCWVLELLSDVVVSVVVDNEVVVLVCCVLELLSLVVVSVVVDSDDSLVVVSVVVDNEVNDVVLTDVSLVVEILTELVEIESVLEELSPT